MFIFIILMLMDKKSLLQIVVKEGWMGDKIDEKNDKSVRYYNKNNVSFRCEFYSFEFSILRPGLNRFFFMIRITKETTISKPLELSRC